MSGTVANLVESFRRLDKIIHDLSDETLIEIIRRAIPGIPAGSVPVMLERTRKLGARAMYQSSFVNRAIAFQLGLWCEENVTLADLDES